MTTLICVVAGVGAVLAVPIGLFGLPLPVGVSYEVERPDGRVTAVVSEEAWVIDVLHVVTIHQNGGLLSRRWDAGCLNGDDPDNALMSVEWRSPTVLTATTASGRELSLRTDAQTGEPDGRLAAGDTSVKPTGCG